MIQNSANHQKRILDDVLTLSKLDSKLLVITPVPTKPEETINAALRMLSSELPCRAFKPQYLLLLSPQITKRPRV